MNRFGVTAAFLSQKPLFMGLQHHGFYIKHQTAFGLSSSSKDEDECSSRQNTENKETQAVRDRMAKWTPRRRRASLSPTERLFTALSEEADGSVHHASRESGNSSTETSVRTDMDFKSCKSSPMNEASRFALVESSKSGINGEEQNKLCHDTHRRKRHLSPLKRFSGMIPEKYWKEDVSASLKQDLDELMKHDDPSKK